MSWKSRIRFARRRAERAFRRLLSPWHERRLACKHSALASLSAAVEARSQSLTVVRRDYVESISTDAMAASAQLCGLAQEICLRWDAVRVADLGSGFSSFALRSLARDDAGLEVWSVDDDEKWLERTCGFLVENSLPTDRCLAWPEVEEDPELRGTFDLLIHDLGHAGGEEGAVVQRARLLPAVLDLLRPGGVLLLDDMHVSLYRRQAREILQRRSLEIFPMVGTTLDRFGRHAWLVVKT